MPPRLLGSAGPGRLAGWLARTLAVVVVVAVTSGLGRRPGPGLGAAGWSPAHFLQPCASRPAPGGGPGPAARTPAPRRDPSPPAFPPLGAGCWVHPRKVRRPGPSLSPLPLPLGASRFLPPGSVGVRVGRGRRAEGPGARASVSRVNRRGGNRSRPCFPTTSLSPGGVIALILRCQLLLARGEKCPHSGGATSPAFPTTPLPDAEGLGQGRGGGSGRDGTARGRGLP